MEVGGQQNTHRATPTLLFASIPFRLNGGEPWAEAKIGKMQTAILLSTRFYQAWGIGSSLLGSPGFGRNLKVKVVDELGQGQVSLYLGPRSFETINDFRSLVTLVKDTYKAMEAMRVESSYGEE